MPKRIDFKPGEVYRFQIELDGEVMIYLKNRAERLKRNITNESSFLINELLYVHMSSSASKLTSKLPDKWLPENQANVTEKTLKSKP